MPFFKELHKSVNDKYAHVRESRTDYRKNTLVNWYGVSLHNIVSMQCGRTVTIQYTCHYHVLYLWKEHWCIKCIWSLHIREKCSTCFVLFIIEKSGYRRGVFSFNWGLFYELNGSGYPAVPVYAPFYSPNICDSKEVPTDLNPLLNKTEKTVNKIKLWSCCLCVFSVLSEKITSHDFAFLFCWTLTLKGIMSLKWD